MPGGRPAWTIPERIWVAMPVGVWMRTAEIAESSGIASGRIYSHMHELAAAGLVREIQQPNGEYRWSRE